MPATIIVGLPGSGKTTLAKGMIEHLDGWELVDDIKDLAALPDPSSVLGVIVCDPHLCIKEVRDNAIAILSAMYGTVGAIYFSNEPDACRSNVASRADGREVGPTIHNLSRLYLVPDGIIPVPVWRPPCA